MKLNLSYLPAELAEAVRETFAELEHTESSDGVVLRAEEDSCLHLYAKGENEIHIGYSRLCEFFRGIGLLREFLREKKEICETGAFDWFSYHEDCSRNGVPNWEATKRMIRSIALMGYNCYILYMEDTFEIPGHPYFGWQRSRYSQAELRKIVAYGKRFGITVEPFLETLGHMEKMLRWKCYQNIMDTSRVLKVGAEETYQFLDDAFTSVEQCFETKRIHIGMDEAYGMGLGAYLKENGYKDQHKLMAEHLKRVVELCRKHHLQPTIASDMFFSPQDKLNRYNSPDVVIPQEVIDSVPEELTLQYWYYYNCEATPATTQMFEHMIEQHTRFHNPVSYAASNWKFTGFVPNNKYAMLAAEYPVHSCIRNGVRDISMNAWGDDGAECSSFAALASVLLYAERLYGREGSIDRRFEELFGMSFEDYMLIDCPNAIPDAEPMGTYGNKAYAKYLLYTDPICGMEDIAMKPEYREHFARCAEKLEKCVSNPHFGYVFDTARKMCLFLKDKCTMSVDMRNAYLTGNRAELEKWVSRMNDVMAELDDFQDAFRTQWNIERKYFGMEEVDIRLGGLRARMVTVKRMLREYLDGKWERLEAFEEPMLWPDCRDVPGCEQPEVWIHTRMWRELTSTSCQDIWE